MQIQYKLVAAYYSYYSTVYGTVMLLLINVSSNGVIMEACIETIPLYIINNGAPLVFFKFGVHVFPG